MLLKNLQPVLCKTVQGGACSGLMEVSQGSPFANAVQEGGARSELNVVPQNSSLLKWLNLVVDKYSPLPNRRNSNALRFFPQEMSYILRGMDLESVRGLENNKNPMYQPAVEVIKGCVETLSRDCNLQELKDMREKMEGIIGGNLPFHQDDYYVKQFKEVHALD